MDSIAVEQLVDAINSSGSLRYRFATAPGKGQQSGCLFRTDTTSVKTIPLPEGFFENTITVEK